MGPNLEEENAALRECHREASEEVKRLRVQCHGMANAALANGHRLLIFERALERIRDLEHSEGAEPLDDAIAYAKKALEPITPLQFDDI